jgi:hypothetical protein
MSEVPNDDVEAWAAREAPRLVEQARAEALEIARERLRDRLVDALVRAAEAPARSARRREQPPQRATPSPESAAESPTGIWVYGVVPGAAAGPPDRPGVDGGRVELVRHQGLAALVTRVALSEFGEAVLKERLEDIERLESLARAHDGVLGAALDRDAVVPFRICTIYESVDSLRRTLEREQAELTGALERLRGKAEWGVKAFLSTGARADRAEAVPAPASGADYLARKQQSRAAADASREAVESIVAGIHARLAERASAATLSRPQDRGLLGRDAEVILNGAYLVPRDDAEDFTGLVGELADQFEKDGLTLELTGPWPAYHFIEGPAR